MDNDSDFADDPAVADLDVAGGRGAPAVNRRRFLTAAGAAGIGLVGTATVGAPSAAAATGDRSAAGATALASPSRTGVGNPLTTPRVAGLHLQFGADAATEVVVSWHSLQPVSWPRVLLGTPDGEFERCIPAATVSYVDAKSGQTVYAHHATVSRLRPATHYLYAAGHDGADPEFADFTTGPRGRGGLHLHQLR